MSAWQPDRLLPGFESLELPFPTTTTARSWRRWCGCPRADAAARARCSTSTATPIISSSAHMAQRFAAEGYAFYALDLRKHGRSLRAAPASEFLQAHRTSTTPTSRGRSTRSARRCCSPGIRPAAWCARSMRTRASGGNKVSAPLAEQPLLRLAHRRTGSGRSCTSAAASGRFLPFHQEPGALPRGYTDACSRPGSSTLRLKPPEGFPVYLGWIAAINDAQHKVQRGLRHPLPDPVACIRTRRTWCSTGATWRAIRADWAPT